MSDIKHKSDVVFSALGSEVEEGMGVQVMALTREQVCGAKVPRITGYSQKGILWTFWDTLLEIPGILLLLAELCSDKAPSSNRH
jgi:hypothetical protein